MMISVAVLAIITVYMTGMLVQQSRSYEVVDDVAEAQQTERAIGDLLERDALATGMLAVAGGVVSGIDNSGPLASDILCVTDADVVGDPTVIGQGMLGIRVVAGYVSGTGTEGLLLSTPSVEQLDNPLEPVVAAYDNTFPQDGVADTDFIFTPFSGLAGGVIVTDPNNPAGGSQCGLITLITGAGPVLSVDWTVTVNGIPLVPAPAGLGAGPKVAIPAHIYFIRPGTLARAPQLMRDGLLLADGVEDLQVAYFHDLDQDGVCDSTEWGGGPCANPVQVAAPYAANARNNCLLRALRFNFVVRTANQDANAALDATKASGSFLQTENAPARGGPLDGFRRRAFSRTVMPRNAPINAGSSPRGCS
jgi:hypothetical protein